MPSPTICSRREPANSIHLKDAACALPVGPVQHSISRQEQERRAAAQVALRLTTEGPFGAVSDLISDLPPRLGMAARELYVALRVDKLLCRSSALGATAWVVALSSFYEDPSEGIVAIDRACEVSQDLAKLAYFRELARYSDLGILCRRRLIAASALPLALSSFQRGMLLSPEIRKLVANAGFVFREFTDQLKQVFDRSNSNVSVWEELDRKAQIDLTLHVFELVREWRFVNDSLHGTHGISFDLYLDCRSSFDSPRDEILAVHKAWHEKAPRKKEDCFYEDLHNRLVEFPSARNSVSAERAA